MINIIYIFAEVLGLIGIIIAIWYPIHLSKHISHKTLMLELKGDYKNEDVYFLAPKGFPKNETLQNKNLHSEAKHASLGFSEKSAKTFASSSFTTYFHLDKKEMVDDQEYCFVR